MIEELIQELENYRTNLDLWEGLKWIAGKDSQGKYIDLNQSRRDKLILALQFGSTKQDQALIEFLFKQEIMDRQNDPFQGVTTQLQRCGFLLASFKIPEYVWLFLEAKTANFDTHCGFDWEYILSAGVNETFDYVELHDHLIKPHFYTYFESKEHCELSQEDIDQWQAYKQTEFPSSIAESDIESWINLGLELNQKEVVSQLLQNWIQHQEWNVDSLKTLKYYQNSLGDLDSEIKTAQKLLAYEENDDLKAYNYYELAQLYLKNNQPLQAWEIIEVCSNTFKNIDNGRLSQLGECALDIVCQAKNKERWLHKAFNFGLLNQPHYFSLHYLSKVVKASQVIGDKDAERRFIPLLDKETKQFEDLKKIIKK